MRKYERKRNNVTSQSERDYFIQVKPYSFRTMAWVPEIPDHFTLRHVTNEAEHLLAHPVTSKSCYSYDVIFCVLFSISDLRAFRFE